MEGIYFTQLKIEQETDETYICSKFLGSPVFPQGFLLNKKGECILNEADYFIMQLNLEDIANRNTTLPKNGMLYFFVNINTLKPKVLYAKSIDEGPLEVWSDINDGFSDDFGDTQGYKLLFDEDLDEGHYILGDINPNIDLETDVDVDGYVTLLEIDFLYLPTDNILRFGEMGISDGRYIFLIKEDDLIKLNFSKVKFIDKED